MDLMSYEIQLDCLRGNNKGTKYGKKKKVQKNTARVVNFCILICQLRSFSFFLFDCYLNQ